MTTEEERLTSQFPGLRGTRYAITSPPSIAYNCVAWAAGIPHSWWEPLRPGAIWPPGIAQETSISAVAAVLALVGYERCRDGELEEAMEKAAIFGNGEQFAHVARQLPSGLWTSKLGTQWDIEHELEALTSAANAGGPVQYGEVVAFLRRARTP